MTDRRSQLDDEVLELLADEPELLAIADAVAETQRPRRRVRPAGIVASAVVLAAVVALAFAFWPNGRSDGISDSTAVAAIGGRAQVVAARFDVARAVLTLRYDRAHRQLTVVGGGKPPLQVSDRRLPPASSSLPASLSGRFGSAVALAVSLVVEYPELVRSDKAEPIATPRGADSTLRWVRYRSSLGYPVDVGLSPVTLAPSRVTEAPSDTPFATRTPLRIGTDLPSIEAPVTPSGTMSATCIEPLPRSSVSR